MLGKIRSAYIIDIIFNNLRNKRKLNIIKYNKKTIFRLNIKEEDFKVYSFLKGSMKNIIRILKISIFFI